MSDASVEFHKNKLKAGSPDLAEKASPHLILDKWWKLSGQPPKQAFWENILQMPYLDSRQIEKIFEGTMSIGPRLVEKIFDKKEFPPRELGWEMFRTNVTYNKGKESINQAARKVVIEIAAINQEKMNKQGVDTIEFDTTINQYQITESKYKKKHKKPGIVSANKTPVSPEEQEWHKWQEILLKAKNKKLFNQEKTGAPGENGDDLTSGMIVRAVLGLSRMSKESFAYKYGGHKAGTLNKWIKEGVYDWESAEDIASGGEEILKNIGFDNDRFIRVILKLNWREKGEDWDKILSKPENIFELAEAYRNINLKSIGQMGEDVTNIQQEGKSKYFISREISNFEKRSPQSKIISDKDNKWIEILASLPGYKYRKEFVAKAKELGVNFNNSKQEILSQSEETKPIFPEKYRQKGPFIPYSQRSLRQQTGKNIPEL